MKRMLIAMVSAIALMMSVIGCQVYDSQTNANLYKDGLKLQDIDAEYSDACCAIRDNSSDKEAKKVIFDSLYRFSEKFWKNSAMTWVKAYVAAQQKAEIPEGMPEAEANKIKEKWNDRVHDVEWCKKTYSDNFMTKERLYPAIMAFLNENAEKECPGKATTESDSQFATRKANFIANYVKTYDGSFADLEVETETGVTMSLGGLWEETYKLKWDYNSKK